MSHSHGNLFQNLTHLQDVRSARASSWDQSGRNQDYWLIPAGESITLADIEGHGCITHGDALEQEWSNGQTEGQVNRLKFIKRQMYGWANFALLRQKVLYYPGST